MNFKTAIYGKYFLLDRIAVGGMAEVFKAKTFGVRGFERLLVIKRILPHLSKDEEFVEMFIDEAKIAVELSHANICQVTDLGKIGDNYFIAMEYIDGKDLRAILKKCSQTKHPLAVPAVLYTAIEVLKGLDYAHRRSDSVTGKPLSIIHRDISPQNVMVSYEGDVKIVDFGIARTEAKLNRTQAGVLKGKFGYMSPEQAAGLELDPRTDVFSVGILLYEMLTGRRLFLGENDFETLEKIKACNVPSPSKYNPGLPPEIERAVLKALSREKEDRFESAREMQVALSRIFYTEYPEFSAKDLSVFLRRLFEQEIESEQESLRRAVDALPADELAAAARAAEAADDRLVESGARRVAPPVGLPSPRDGPLPGRIPFPARLPAWKPFLVRLAVLCVSVTAGGFLAWKWLAPGPSKTPPGRAAAPAAGAAVQITSDPAGAAVFIDDKPVGPAPVLLRLEPKRVYSLRLEKSGFRTFSEKLLVTEDQPSYGPYRLEPDLPKAGSLRVLSDPPGARISIDQARTSLRTPATLENVTLNEVHRIRLELDGFKPASQKVVLKKAEDEVRIGLERNVATLRINVHPEDARVLVDGRERGHVIEDLVPGTTYSLLVEKEGYDPERRKIRLGAAVEYLNVELKKREIIYGTISIGAVPWATVIINGKEVGMSPILDYRLPVGEHTVILRHPDYKPVQQKIRIDRGKNRDLIHDFRS